MTISSQLQAHLQALTEVFEQARQRAIEHGAERVLASYALAVEAIDLLELFCRADQPGVDALFWRAADGGRSLFGWGLESEVRAWGDQRFSAAEQQWQQWLDNAVICGAQPPLLCGGFRFDHQVAPAGAWQGFDDASLWLMGLLLIREGDQCWLVCQQHIGPEDDARQRSERVLEAWNCLMDRYLSPSPDPTPVQHCADQCMPRAAWEDKVVDALDALRATSMQKVVLAREVISAFSHTLSPGRTLARLASAEPSAYLFAFRRQQRCFIGASPERLARLHEGHLQTLALAGTCRRDADPHLDARLASALLDCEKNRHEHAVVVHIIEQALAPWTSQLRVASTPSIQRLSRVQHLSTVIEGRLRPQASLLQVVAALHPTPAVGGHERRQAMDYIRRYEGFDRGWYAAPLGWLDASGNGEFIVGLRSALVHGERARLFAGCGIVQRSEPASEYEETCIKLAGMQQALQA